MASLALLSLGRHAFSPIQFSISSVLRTGLRSFGSTSPSFHPLPTPEYPKVANTAEKNKDAKDLGEVKWTTKSQRAMTDLSALPALNPYSGRSVPVRGNLADSLKRLDSIMSRNKVKLQLRMTERHEKKGYKRRRLESERWRNQFANEVRKKVQLVMKMRDRGA